MNNTHFLKIKIYMSDFFVKLSKIFKGFFIFYIYFANFDCFAKEINYFSNCILVHFNDEIITKSDLNERLKLIAFFNNAPLKNILENEEMRSSILKALLDEKILYQKAEILKIKPKKVEIDGFEKNFFMNAGVDIEKLGGIQKFLSKNGLSYNAFQNFILNEILIAKIIEHHKDEINESKEIENLFKNFNKFQKKSEFTEYSIIEFLISQKKDPEEKVKILEKSENCKILKENLKKFEIIFDEYDVQTKSMSDDLLNQIKLQNQNQGEKTIGFVSFNAQKETLDENALDDESDEKINFIGFCPKGQKHISKIELNDLQLDSLFQKNLINKAILGIIENGKNENYISFNETCK